MEEYTYCPYCDEEVEVIDHGTGIQKKVCPECDEVFEFEIVVSGKLITTYKKG